MTREDAIQTIESLFPADSQYSKTKTIGEQLLKQAKSEIIGWRTEPEAVLIRYAELCEREETIQDRHFFANRHGHH